MKLPEEATLQRVATFVATLGIAVAAYIAIADSGGGAPVCLAGGSGCQTVADSIYSHLFGVDITVFGVIGYVLLLGAAVLRGDGARFAGFVLSLGGFGYSVYLTYLELYKIEAICQWCLGSAVLMTVLLAVGAMRLVGYAGAPAGGMRSRPERPTPRVELEEGRRRQLIRLAAAAAFLAIAAVAVLIVVSQSETSGGDTKLEDVRVVESHLEGIPQSGTQLGNPEAKATLVEFGDLQCPVCKAFSEGIVAEFIAGPVSAGKARLDFRNYTIISEASIPAGAAAIAAGEQGRGWNFVELFYRNQGIEGTDYVDDAFLTAIAKGAGVPDIAKWNSERKSRRVLAEVAKQTEEAKELGFTGTPSFAVQGPGGKLETLDFPSSVSELEAAVKQAP
jgi:protein-disulfide isomerase